MPSNFTGRRKVRCPKCTALLTEPQTQIYECPICATLLLAKGYALSRSSDNRVHVNGGDAEDLQKIIDGGAKLEKARLINNDQELQRGQSENNRDLERECVFQPETFDRRTLPESHAPWEPSNQSHSGAKHNTPESAALSSEFSSDAPRHVKSGEASPSHGPGRRSSDLDSASHSESEAYVDRQSHSGAKHNNPKCAALSSEFSADIPHHIKLGEASPSHGSGHQSSDLDSASHSESEAYVDSPLWSSENANSSEVPEVHSLRDSSFVNSSSEPMNYVTSLDRAERMQGESNSGKDAECDDGRQKSDFNEGSTLNLEVANDKKVGCSYISSLEGNNNGIASNASSKTLPSSVIDKGTDKGLSKDSQSDAGRKEISNVGKFRLFDLSVFGIYNEETYDVLRLGKVASLAESGNNGETMQPPAENVIALSQLSDILAQDLSYKNDQSGDQSHENISHFEKNAGVLESPVVDIEGTYVGAGDNCEKHMNAFQEDTDTGSLGAFGGEAENGGKVSVLEDEELLLASDRDNDALAKARYGDVLTIRELSLEAASVDMSFGDWRSEQLTKPSIRALEPNPDADCVDEKGEEDTDSSFDNDEELTFSSTAKGDSKPQGAAAMHEDAHSSLNGGPQAQNVTEKLAFPLRTTAMQKFLQQRDDQQSAAQMQPSQAESVLYEAPYMEHCAPLPEKGPQEASDEMLPLMPEQEERNVPLMKGHGRPAEALEDTGKEFTELQSESLQTPHGSPSSNVKNVDVSVTPAHWKEGDRRQIALPEHAHSKKDIVSVMSSQGDAMVVEMDHTDQEATAFASQKVDYVNQWNANKLGNAAGKPASLRWKGKGSSTQSISSTEDEGAYGMESEAGSGPEKSPSWEGGVGQIGRPLPDKEVIFGSGQQPRDPAGRGSQRTWLSTIETSRQKHGSGELATSRRTARSRPSNERLSYQGSFAEADRLQIEGRSSDLDTFGRSGLGRPAGQFPGYVGPGLNLNRDELDKRSNYLYNDTADYNSDHSSRSQDVPPHSHYNDYMSKSHGSASGANARAYPFQVPPHGSLALASSQEQGHAHLAHSHHGVSGCSVCIQQQYFMQQSHMHQPHPCAACAAQASAAYQPMHHEMHAHHMHGLTPSNPSLKHHDSGALSAQSRRQNRSSVQHNHPVIPARRISHYPPLPGRGAPPFVLCRHCNQLLQVPEYLPPTIGYLQKLHCGPCGKISKFSFSQAINRNHWSTETGVTMNASDLHGFVARDTQHADIPSVHSSGQISSSGFSPSLQSLHGKGRHIPGQGPQHAWVENRASSQPNIYGIASTQSEIGGFRHQLRPMAGTAGSGQAPYGNLVRRINGDYASNDTGLYNEDYFSSSPSSASGASPGRQYQLSRDNQRAPQPLGMARPAPGDRKFSLDLPARSTLHEQGRSPFEAPSFSDSLFQKGVSENTSRALRTSLQGSVHDPQSPRSTHAERSELTSKAGSWHNEPADVEYSGINTSRNRIEQVRKVPVAPGSPLIEHFTQDAADAFPSVQHRHLLQNSGNGSRSTPWSPKSESQASPPYDPYSQDASADIRERTYEDDRLRMPNQDGNKGPKSFAGLLKRSIKDLSKGGQGGGNRRKVVVNGYLIPEAAVRMAEEGAGPIHSGTYWYDSQAGFWGLMGGPCLGILMPFIEEFHFPLARDCSGGKTGILVNGRELHEKDLEVLAKRGLPTNPGKAYILDISGALFDDVSGQPLKGLGKLAPSIEKRGRGFGMSPSTAQT